MKYLFYLIIFSLFFSSCDDKKSENTVVIPTNLVVSVSNTNDVNGIVSVTAQATNALHYSFDFGDGSEAIANQTGMASNNYTESGTFEIIIKAFGNSSSEFISQTEEVIIQNAQDLSSPPTSGYESPASYSGMEQVWSDEFTGTSVNSLNWGYDIGGHGWGNNELQFYREENATVANGALLIEAKEETFGGRNYTSSRLLSQRKQEFQYGRIDIRAALPFGQGIWPALWMLGANFSTVGWPRCGEIDIMEYLGHNRSQSFGTLHWANASGDRACTCGDQNSYYNLPTGNFTDEWHVFSIMWDENKIEWLVDNTKFYETMINTEQEEFRNEFFFIMNIAVGGNLPGSPNATTSFPQRMFVDYVRVFQNR